MLLGRVHALRRRRLAKELPPLRLPRRQLQRSSHTRISIPELLEVRRSRALPTILSTAILGL